MFWPLFQPWWNFCNESGRTYPSSSDWILNKYFADRTTYFLLLFLEGLNWNNGLLISTLEWCYTNVLNWVRWYPLGAILVFGISTVVQQAWRTMSDRFSSPPLPTKAFCHLQMHSYIGLLPDAAWAIKPFIPHNRCVVWCIFGFSIEMKKLNNVRNQQRFHAILNSRHGKLSALFLITQPLEGNSWETNQR